MCNEMALVKETPVPYNECFVPPANGEGEDTKATEGLLKWTGKFPRRCQGKYLDEIRKLNSETRNDMEILNPYHITS